MSKICMGCMSPYGDEYTVCPMCGYAEGTKAAEALHMVPGTILRKRYIIGRVLGFGGFGVTYIGWDAQLERKVAVKEYLPSEFSTRIPGQSRVTVFNGDKQEQFRDGLKKFVEESQRLARFQTLDGIVKIYDSFAENDTAYIIMEYLEGETLAERLKRQNTIPPDEAVAMLTPVIQSLRAVHGQGIIHRDIAPDNIFLTKDGQVKLIDFGASRYATTSHSRSLTVIIKPGYSPEEQYRSRGDQGPHTDVYAIGATLYRMITGDTPPDALERRAFFETKQKDILKPPSHFQKDIPKNQETAILNALNVRIEDRTPDMAVLEAELTSEDAAERKQGRIKKIDPLKWPPWARIAAAAAALSIVVLSVLFAFGVIGPWVDIKIDVPEGMSLVPSVVNDSLDSAEARLNDEAHQVKLLYSIVGKEYSNLVPANLILTQDINAGSVVPQNTVLQLSISGGAETRTVPDVTELNGEEAVRQLEELGFAVQIEYEYSQVVAEGAVVSQSAAGDEELEIGSAVTLVVSRGIDPGAQIEQKLSVVPDFVGMNYTDAQNAARGAGFVLSVRSREYSGEFARDIVMTQSVPAGSEIMSGNTVELVVSLGVQTVKVPDVQYKTEADARKLLGDRGLSADVTYVESETVAAGLVISQNPAAQAAVSPNTAVALVVSTGGKPFLMPNVVGMSETDAYYTLSGKGLSVSVSYEQSSTAVEGTVLRQSPARDTSVSRGAGVSITVCSGQPLVSVPHVVAQTERDARNTLTSKGFNVQVFYANSDTWAKGIVMTQSPASGTSQPKGWIVTLTVSNGPVDTSVSVPNVVGKTRTVAENTLLGAGFSVSVSNEAYSDTVPKGSVISQSPPAGANAKKGDTVFLTVSLGKEQFPVPDVIGKSRSSAVTTLTNSGFSVNFLETYSDSVPEGYVVSQSPGPGVMAYKGSWVTLTVSLGPDPNKIKGLRLDPTSMTLAAGDSRQIVVYPDPANADLRNLTWSSDNLSVAAVSGNGLVTAKAAGSATIRAEINGKSWFCLVVVEKKPISKVEVYTLPYKLTYNAGDTLNTDGLSLKVTYTDRTSEYFSTGFSCSPMILTSLGTQKITVTYPDYTGAPLTFDVQVNAVTVTVSPKSVTLNGGETRQLTAAVTGTTNTAVTWSSSFTNVATVSQTGLVTAQVQPVNSVTLNQTSGTLNVNDNVQLIATVNVPNTSSTIVTATSKANASGVGACEVWVNPPDRTVTWSSGNTSVATVSASGQVTAKAAGTATITAASNADGTKKGTYTLTVSPKNISVSVSPKTVTMDGGATRQLSAVVTGTTDTSVTWSSVGSVATVSPTGLVTAQVQQINSISLNNTSLALDVGNTASLTATVSAANGGAATVTAASREDPNQKDTCTVTVNPADKSVTWSSSNTNVATVSNTGVITAKAAGSVTITVTSNADGTKTASCNVNVKSGIQVSLDYTNVTWYLGEGGGTITATTNVEGAWFDWTYDSSLIYMPWWNAYKNYEEFSLRDSKVGTTTIKCTVTKDGQSASATCSVTVKERYDIQNTINVSLNTQNLYSSGRTYLSVTFAYRPMQDSIVITSLDTGDVMLQKNNIVSGGYNNASYSIFDVETTSYPSGYYRAVITSINSYGTITTKSHDFFCFWNN